MHYTEVDITFSPYSQQHAEILSAMLGEEGFDCFTDKANGLLAYIPSELFVNINLDSFFESLNLKLEFSFTATQIEDQNWNKQWESNFDPITVENYCRVRAPFHPSEKGYDLEIVIEPKMAFGTGHHQTTWLMIWELFQLNLKGKNVLDMGCGTGILAIVAEKLGAKSVTAIDIDSWAYENALENTLANGCNKIKVQQGDARLLGNDNFDIILANINLNILLNDIPTYIKTLPKGGLLVMSGILTDDIPRIAEFAKQNTLEVISNKTKNDWAMVLTKKKE